MNYSSKNFRDAAELARRMQKLPLQDGAERALILTDSVLSECAHFAHVYSADTTNDGQRMDMVRSILWRLFQVRLPDGAANG